MRDIHPRIPFDQLPRVHRRRVVYALIRLEGRDNFEATLLRSNGLAYDPEKRIRLHIHIANILNYISGMPLQTQGREESR